MKTPQILYIEINKCEQKLNLVHSEMETIEAQLRAGFASMEPKKKSLLNPMAGMPDLDALETTLSVLPALLAKRTEERALNLEFRKLNVELLQVLTNQHLQGVSHG